MPILGGPDDGSRILRLEAPARSVSGREHISDRPYAELLRQPLPSIATDAVQKAFTASQLGMQTLHFNLLATYLVTCNRCFSAETACCYSYLCAIWPKENVLLLPCSIIIGIPKNQKGLSRAGATAIPRNNHRSSLPLPTLDMLHGEH